MEHNHWNNHNPYYKQILQTIEQNNPNPEWTVVSRKPEQVYYYAGLKSECYPLSRNRTEVYEFLMQHDYVIYDATRGTDRLYLAPILQDSFKHFSVMAYIPQDNPLVVLFKIIK